ncbi:OmpA family protein [Mesorhizobium captivum]|uniref:OmpA family protein n=1 Tax=Mesorhizobium captivum TaxID=3072319 RepID=A0ABU4Z8J8_9HYPH|nr:MULTISPECIES: OmpA family protein [unclassified Mesorhizobium]MDX8447694.1 OmpA family protein [Mesorhizobium sp. VK3C]MDX8495566.1 OmpA family protein [Mesorhizobium sp. VK22B]MDX8508996.1 OmpA family protein [Mesorhizobium sp. VK22E]
MASAPLGAYPLQADFGTSQGAPLILAQTNCAEGQSAEECAQGGQQGEQPRKKKREQQQQTESAPAEQSAEPEQKPRRKRQDQQQMDSGQAEQAAPAEQQLKPRKKRDQQQQIEAAPADQGGQPVTDEQQPRRKKRQQQQTETAPAEQPAGQAAPANDEQQPRKKKRQQQQTETAPAEQPAEQAAPANDEQQPRKKKRQQQQTETAPAEQPAEQAAPANDNTPQDKLRRKKRDQQQQTETAPTEQAPKAEAPAGEPAQQAEPQQNNQQAAPAEGEQPLDKTKKRRKALGQQPGAGQAVTGEQPSTKQPSTEGQATTGGQPATGEQPAQGGANAGTAAQGEAPANANEAPLFDSQKDVVRKRKGRQPAGQNENGQAGVEQGGNQAGQQGGNQAEQQGGQQAQRPAPVDQGPPPTDDKAAQQEIKPEKLVPVTEEKGKRIELTPEQVVRERRRPQGADVVKQFGDRVIVQFNNQTIVESNEAPRITRGARDVYYEDLPRSRTREIVERDNGVKIVTIRNRNGDVVQRSRIMPDGREYVLSYVDERYYQDVDDWRDPGDDLPPMRLDIPRRDYILDSEEVEDPDEYYTFLEQPPVERVQRLYSIDEVKRSARVRDIARRIDLDTLNFDFGSATISDTEVQKLEGVATAMEKLLKKNPAETFLIEGHTDAVGTPDANLALSDRRAEAVAEALTNAFGIPAENLTTQGYGEEYLKVNTSGPNRENRRVAIRRITSLVAPVASNNEQ